MNKTRKSLLNVVMFILVLKVSSLHSQMAPQLRTVVPPSPNVASLGKYGDIPVSLYTGIPNITVPLYEIQNGSLKLPLSISYHAAGVKVEEIASSVGLGWSLNAGGIINRSVKGVSDQLRSWYPQPATSTVESIMLGSDYQDFLDLKEDVSRGIRDGEPDVYHFNFAQHTGKFIFDQAGNAHTIPAKNLIITPDPTWKIVDEDGTVYGFTMEETVNSFACTDYSNITAWYLTSITSSDGKRVITLSYDAIYYNYETLSSETKYFPMTFDVNSSGCLSNPYPCSANHSYYTYRLKKIDFEQGYVKFNYNTDRCDLIGEKALDQIEVYTNDDALVKRFNFKYSYFGETSDCSGETAKEKRLKLLSVAEELPGEVKPPYEFSYNESVQLPGRLSYAQDHWGYYNGKVNNPGLIPRFLYRINSGEQVIGAGADRKANPETSQAAILTKITYPTGGETLFTYENNTTNDYRADPDTEEQEMFLLDTGMPIPVPYESFNEIVIPEGSSAMVRYFVQGPDCLGPPPNWQDCDIQECKIEVIKDNNIAEPFRQIGNTSDDLEEVWPAGRYKLRAVIDCAPDKPRTFSITIKAEVPVAETEGAKIVGGLRIKTIEDRPADGGEPIVKNYRYHLENDVNQSSGIILNWPHYEYTVTAEKIVYDPICVTLEYDYCGYIARNSASSYPLATTQGSYVGYGHVIVDSGENGESRYTYVAYPDFPTAENFPPVPSESQDWRRGSLLSVKEFKKQGSELILVKETTNSYYSANEKRTYAIKTGKNHFIIASGGDECNWAGDGPYAHAFYPVFTEFYVLSQTSEKIYDQEDPAKFVETIKDFTYDDQHLQLTQTKITTSNSRPGVKEEVVTNKKYSFDYEFAGSPAGDEAQGIKNLKDLHVASAVIEEYVVKQLNSSGSVSDQRVIGGMATTYKPDLPYPDQVFTLQISEPIPITTFGTGSVITNDAFVKNDAYKPYVAFTEFDDKGNLVSQRKADDVVYSYLWGYEKSYPIAEVINNSQNDNIAYTSFEEESQGNWTYNTNGVSQPSSDNYTGHKNYLLTGTSFLNKALLDPTVTYVLSYWYKNGASVSVTGGPGIAQADMQTRAGANDWTLSTRKVTGTTSITISGSGRIDEVRLHPVQCRMTTYTYDPLVGMTSSTDHNNVKTVYKYDALNRLKAIKDSEEDIVKMYEYNYKLR